MLLASLSTARQRLADALLYFYENAVKAVQQVFLSVGDLLLSASIQPVLSFYCKRYPKKHFCH